MPNNKNLKKRGGSSFTPTSHPITSTGKGSGESDYILESLQEVENIVQTAFCPKSGTCSLPKEGFDLLISTIKSIFSVVSDLKLAQTKFELTTCTSIKNVGEAQLKNSDSISKVSNIVFKTHDVIEGLEKTVEATKELALSQEEKLKDEVKQEVEKLCSVKPETVTTPLESPILRKCEYLAETMDRKLRRYNVILRGLKEDEEESGHAIHNKIKLINQELSVDLERTQFRARRLGVRVPGRDRPVLVRFDSVESRNKVWNRKVNLRESTKFPRVYVDEDLPKEIAVQRRLARAEARAKVNPP